MSNITCTTYSMAAGRELLLVAPDTITPATCDELAALVELHRPDTVCVPLDARRLEWRDDRAQWESLNVVDMMRRRQLAQLWGYLALRIFDKRIGRYDDAEPGDEVWAAVCAARACGCNIVMADRDMVASALRAWRRTSFLGRARLGASLTSGALQRTDRTKAGVDSLEVFTARFPVAARCLIDERAAWMLDAAERAPGRRVMLLAGPACQRAVRAALDARQRGEPDGLPATAQLDVVPTKHPVSRALPWVFSIAFLAAFVLGFVYVDTSTMQDIVGIWFVVNFVCTAIGAAVAGAHIGAILAAATSSPIVSFNPFLGAGMFGAFAQMLLVPPSIRDIERVGDDIARLRGWWTNRLARVVLIFVLANGASTAGTFVALGLVPYLL